MDEEEAPAQPVRAPRIGDHVVYWPPKLPGRPYIPVAREARVAGIAADGTLTLSVLNPANGQRFRATVPAQPEARAPRAWSWPEA